LPSLLLAGLILSALGAIGAVVSLVLFWGNPQGTNLFKSFMISQIFFDIGIMFSIGYIAGKITKT